MTTSQLKDQCFESESNACFDQCKIALLINPQHMRARGLQYLVCVHVCVCVCECVCVCVCVCVS